MPPRIDGIVPIVAVPFHADGRIDEHGLRRVVDFCVTNHASAVCLPAYASEYYKLSDAERLEVVRIAVSEAAGRIPVIGQANHPSAAVAIELARQMQADGAQMISVAAPRLFPLAEADLVRYFTRIGSELRIPLLVQDFNPGGATVGPEFARRLRAACPNFRYLKLEDPMMGPRIRAILEATDGEIGVLEGWGGMFMMELVPCGLCGVMPGVPLLRVLDQVYRKRRAGDAAGAYAAYQAVLPFIVFTLQHMELFLHVEKRLLKALGVIDSAHVREATIEPDADSLEYADFLIAQLLPLLT